MNHHFGSKEALLREVIQYAIDLAEALENDIQSQLTFPISGIVVNDSLVLVCRLDNLRADGMSLRESVLETGPQRFCAILPTTLTTFIGLVAILLEPSMQVRFLKPMAVSVAFGVVFATAIPCCSFQSGAAILLDPRCGFWQSTPQDLRWKPGRKCHSTSPCRPEPFQVGQRDPEKRGN